MGAAFLAGMVHSAFDRNRVASFQYASAMLVVLVLSLITQQRHARAARSGP